MMFPKFNPTQLAGTIALTLSCLIPLAIASGHDTWIVPGKFQIQHRRSGLHGVFCRGQAELRRFV